MKVKLFNCPSCNERMVMSELKCPKCDLRIRKDFESCDFCSLPEQDHEFLLVFLRAQGRITDMEKVLGVSYPTIKAKIDSLLKNLNLSPIAAEEEHDPLEALAQGKISVDEAVAILRQRKKR
ncbi:hypothetical protein AMJ83_04105 [candidate division WOR_3 bacterium SM23_42]|uniref:DUF2089 domain-containing protein n=1 Tax=candidate division WOR_3 bacterium SM23_42 TaxID=1703779 RepID=A0A0S8FTZ6_UNCW3|nr:MAG: hypothetical protein AMJ83_04105 [candidate division WOR_3 bacterium SM23_42]